MKSGVLKQTSLEIYSEEIRKQNADASPPTKVLTCPQVIIQLINQTGNKRKGILTRQRIGFQVRIRGQSVPESGFHI